MTSKKNILQRQGEIRKLMEDLDRDINEKYNKDRIISKEAINKYFGNLDNNCQSISQDGKEGSLVYQGATHQTRNLEKRQQPSSDTFCLSDKRYTAISGEVWIEERHIKQFIKLLKKEIRECSKDGDWFALLYGLNKLAGQSLISDDCNSKILDENICKCGHDYKDHSYYPSDLVSGLFGCDICECSGFQANNGQETKPLSDSDESSGNWHKTPDSFCLSDKIDRSEDWDILQVEDVKEFIRLLKEEYKIICNNRKNERLQPNGFNFVINKLAGQSLISDNSSQEKAKPSAEDYLDNENNTLVILSSPLWEHISQCEYRKLKRDFPKTYHGFTARIGFQYYKKRMK